MIIKKRKYRIKVWKRIWNIKTPFKEEFYMYAETFKEFQEHIRKYYKDEQEQILRVEIIVEE